MNRDASVKKKCFLHLKKHILEWWQLKVASKDACLIVKCNHQTQHHWRVWFVLVFSSHLLYWHRISDKKIWSKMIKDLIRDDVSEWDRTLSVFYHCERPHISLYRGVLYTCTPWMRGSMRTKPHKKRSQLFKATVVVNLLCLFCSCVKRSSLSRF